MCFNFSLLVEADFIEKYYGIQFGNLGYLAQVNFNVYNKPQTLIVNQEKQLEKIHWFPKVAFQNNQGKIAEYSVFNARDDKLFISNLWKKSILERRCIVPVSGFMEHHHIKTKNYPFYIRHKNTPLLSLGGIWNTWTDPRSQQSFKVLSIITVDANPALQIIHNKKKRMPLILPRPSESLWLDKSLKSEHLQKLLQPYQQQELEYFSIAKNYRSFQSAQALVPHPYDELQETYQELEKLNQ
jgi:putative SOS response-associated peptidase YedK